MKKSLKITIIACASIFVLLALFFAYTSFSNNKVALAPADGENLNPIILGGEIDATTGGADCKMTTFTFPEEWKEECKKACFDQDCRDQIDAQQTIKGCKPNQACLDRHGVEWEDVEYTCQVAQYIKDLRFEAELKCDRFICTGIGLPILYPCRCAKDLTVPN